MIHFVSGDILLSRAQVLVQGVAPSDPMTHGLALSVREKYPALHKDFHIGAANSIPSRARRGCGDRSAACAS